MFRRPRLCVSEEQRSEWSCERIVFLNKRFQIEVCSLYPDSNLITKLATTTHKALSDRRVAVCFVLLVS